MQKNRILIHQLYNNMNHNIFVSSVLIIAFLWHLWQQVYCQGQSYTQIHFTNAGNCDTKGLKFFVNYFYITHHYSKNYLNASYYAIDDIKELKRAYLHIERCNDLGYNCEDFQNWRIDRLCQMLAWKNQLWSDFVDHFQPPFRCPIKRTTYQVYNWTADPEILMKWYPDMERFRWKVSIKVTNEHDNVVCCASLEAHFQQFTKQNQKPSRRPKHDLST